MRHRTINRRYTGIAPRIQPDAGRILTWCLVLGVLSCPVFAPTADTPARKLCYHTADTNGDWRISLSELLRVIQFYNGPDGAYYYGGDATEDGFAATDLGFELTGHFYHDSDYVPPKHAISLTELLRLVQFYNSDRYFRDITTEDGFAASRETPDYSKFFRATFVCDNPRDEPIYRDLTGDALPDIIVAKSHQGIFIYENSGDRSFVEHTVHTGNDVRLVTATDGDNDGDEDIIYRVSSAGSDEYWYVANEGALAFSIPQPIAIAPDTRQYMQHPRDLDGDGREDLWAGVGWYRNTGAFEYEEYHAVVPPTQPPGGGQPEPQCPRLVEADLNADGRPDLFGTTYTWRVTSPEGEGFEGQGEGSKQEGGKRTKDWYCGDDQFLIALINQGDGSFDYHEIIPLDDFGAFAATHAGDIDGSGTLDCFVAYDDYPHGNANLAILDAGGANWTKDPMVGPAWVEYPHSLEDVDGDGDADLVVVQQRDMNAKAGKARMIKVFVGWIENSEGTFTTGQCLASNFACMGCCDFDMDGRPDLALESSRDYSLHILWNEMPVESAKSVVASPTVQ